MKTNKDLLIEIIQEAEQHLSLSCSICKVREDMGECERLRKTNRTSECSEFRRIKDEKTKNMA